MINREISTKNYSSLNSI